MDDDDADADPFTQNCIIYTGGPDGCDTLRVELDPLHGALERFRVAPSHCCYPGYGLRVRYAIAGGTYLGSYGGVRVPVLALVDTTPYTMAFDGSVSAVEALNYGNVLRYMNDPRGMTRFGEPVQANVRTEQKWVATASGRRKSQYFATAAFYTVRNVAAGEELLVDYGADYDMGLRPRPWMAEAECKSVVPAGAPLDSTETGESAAAPPVKKRRHKQEGGGGDGDDDVGQCSQMLDMLRALSAHWKPDVATLRRQLEHELLTCIKRKLEHWPLRADNFSAAEFEMLARLRRAYDPGHPIRCRGPCQRELPRSHFGPVEMRSQGWGWPPCNECCEGFMKEPTTQMN